MQMIDQKSREEYTNNEHLRLLSIFYFVFGGLSLFIAFILLIYLVVLGAIFTNTTVRESIESSGTNLDTPLNIVAAAFIFAILLVTTVGILQIMAGYKLRKKTHRTFTMVVGAITLPSFPLGTALGVFTIIVLTRPSVVEMYEKQPEIIKQRILNPDGF